MVGSVFSKWSVLQKRCCGGRVHQPFAKDMSKTTERCSPQQVKTIDLGLCDRRGNTVGELKHWVLVLLIKRTTSQMRSGCVFCCKREAARRK